jgi:malate dehydrogenase (oxaloacetate-decarboxylating)
MNYFEESLKLHKEKQGKLETVAKVPLNNKHDLSISYSP